MLVVGVGKKRWLLAMGALDDDERMQGMLQKQSALFCRLVWSSLEIFGVVEKECVVGDYCFC
jgi:hypothetical protein